MLQFWKERNKERQPGFSERGKDPEISLEEQLINMREWRYRIYLQVGNMSDILNMQLNDFKSIVDMMIHQGTSPEKRFKQMSASQKNMIKRKKELG
jgi:hypothetical protein